MDDKKEDAPPMPLHPGLKGKGGKGGKTIGKGGKGKGKHAPVHGTAGDSTIEHVPAPLTSTGVRFLLLLPSSRTYNFAPPENTRA